MVKRRLLALVSRRYSELQAKRHAGSHHGSRRRWFRNSPGVRDVASGEDALPW
jgi:hypothetical protein